MTTPADEPHERAERAAFAATTHGIEGRGLQALRDELRAFATRVWCVSTTGIVRGAPSSRADGNSGRSRRSWFTRGVAIETAALVAWCSVVGSSALGATPQGAAARVAGSSAAHAGAPGASADSSADFSADSRADASAEAGAFARADARARGAPEVQGAPDEAVDAGELALAVNRAIAAGVANLKRLQLPDGNWPGQEGPHPGGMTALACFTLVKSGVKKNDEAVVRALGALSGTTFKSTYSHAVRLMLCDALREPAKWRATAEDSVRFLASKQDGPTGGWAYPEGGVDMSNTQFALLGLRSARRIGVDVPEETWVRAANGLLRFRDAEGRGWASESGGFKYWTHREATGGMTAATLAGLSVIREHAPPSSEVHALLRKHAKTIAASEAWLVRRFRADQNPSGERSWTPSFQFAYLWAVERFGGLTGKTELGTHDWYTEGATWLVEQQKSDGSWGNWIEDTCFALLFLRKATLTESDAPLAPADPLFAGEPVVPPKRPKPGTPWLVDWWVAGPFADKGVDLESPPFEPAKARGREKAKLANRVFERIALKPDGWTDLDQATGRAADQALWLCTTTLVNTTAAPFDVELWLVLEDGWSVWFDGRRVSFDRRVAAPIEESVRVPLELAPGEHVLTVVIEDQWGAAAFGARVARPGGVTPGPEFASWAVAPKEKR